MVMRAELARRPAMAAMARLRGVEVGESVPLAAHIDIQRVFTGFAAFPEGQLPLGGMAVTERALADVNLRAKLERVRSAYAEASVLLTHNSGAHAEDVAALFQHYYAPLGAGGPPAMLLARSIEAGDLVYRGDLAPVDVSQDLIAWIAELNGQAPDAGFIAA
jgi:hypothetical protein